MPKLKSAEPEPITLTERDATILEVATEIFADRGFSNTDVQEIADALGIGKATIYRAFGTKEELFLATVQFGMSKLSEKLRAVGEEKCGHADALQAWLLAFFSFFNEHPQLIELLMQERSEFRDRDSHSYVRYWLSNSPHWRARIQEAVADGRFRAVDADSLIDTLSALCYGTIFISYFSNKKINLEQTAKFISEVVWTGVLSETEQAERRKGNPHGKQCRKR